MKTIFKFIFLFFIFSHTIQLQLKSETKSLLQFFNNLFTEKNLNSLINSDTNNNNNSEFAKLEKNFAKENIDKNSNKENDNNNDNDNDNDNIKSIFNLNFKDNNNNNEANNNNNNDLSNNFRFKSFSTENNKKLQIQLQLQTEKVLYEGYHKISSILFRNKKLFPDLKIPNYFGKIVKSEIKLDRKYFRINNSYKQGKNATLDNKDFYFKVTDEHLFYANDKTDVNVLQIFNLEKYDRVRESAITYYDENLYLINYCFEIIEYETKFTYKICNLNKAENLKLMCLLNKKLMRITLSSCTSPDKNDDFIDNINTTITQEVIDATIIIPLPSKTCNHNWNYNSHGDDWECKCQEGKEQSPIDIPDSSRTILSPITPIFQFEFVSAKSPISTIEGEVKEDENIKIQYLNGALRVLSPNFGKITTLNGADYIGEEITIHTPSEHLLKGVRYDMEVQITFYGVTKGDIAKQVVLSFLFEKKPGYYNRFIDDLDFYTLPNKVNTEKVILNDLYIPKIFHSVVGGEGDNDDFLVLKPFSFFTYDGSLTMPPCSEETIHYVVSDPLPIGNIVLELAREALKSPDMKQEDNLGNSNTIVDDDNVENYRRTQDINNRNVFFFDAKIYCKDSFNNVIDNRNIGSHFEKVKKTSEIFVFVPGDKPSGIPGSFLVGKNEAGVKIENE